MKELLKRYLPAPVLGGLRSCKQQISAIPRRASPVWHQFFGKSYCPLCEKRVGEFNPLSQFYYDQLKAVGCDAGEFPAETCNEAHYSCPRCDASDRERLYALYLGERLKGVPPTFKLVDFAPSPSLRRWIQQKFKIQYRTADLYMEDVDDRADLTDLANYATASVDAFICSHMLEHIREDTKAMTELLRILKPGGWGILMVPISLGQAEILEDPAKATTEADRWRYFGQGDHVRRYSKKGFMDRVTAAGFHLISVPADHFGPALTRKCGITPTSVLYIGEKS